MDRGTGRSVQLQFVRNRRGLGRCADCRMEEERRLLVVRVGRWESRANELCLPCAYADAKARGFRAYGASSLLARGGEAAYN